MFCKINIIVFLAIIQLVNAHAQKNANKYLSDSYWQYIDSANFYVKKDYNKAFDFIEKAMAGSIKQRDEIVEAECFILLGKINSNLGQYDLAISNYNKAASIFQKLKNRRKLSEVKRLLGEAYNNRNDYEEGLKNLNQSLTEAEQANDIQQVLTTKNEIASVYAKKGDTDKAIKGYKEVSKLQRKSGNKRGLISSNENLGRVYTKSKKQREALQIYAENEAISEELKDTISLKSSLSGQALAFKEMGDYDAEIKVRKRSVELSKLSKDVEGEAKEVVNIGESYLQQQKVDDAISYLEQGIDLSKKTKNVEQKGAALKTLSKAYDIAGRSKKAISTYKRYVKTVDEIYKKREEKNLKDLKAISSISKKLQRIDMLENEKKLSERTYNLMVQEQNLQKSKVKQQQTIIYSLIGGLLLLFVVSFLAYKSSKQKQVANQLLVLRSLRSQMNPHFIFNSLNSINSFIAKNDIRTANKYLADFARLMRAVMENSKHDLVPLANEIDILTLYLKLEHFRFNNKFDYQFTIDKAIDVESYEIPPMLIQPYIENAIWHGLRYKKEKGMLKINFKNENNLQVIIEDNGIGRKKSKELKTKNQKLTKSTGIKNINNRIKLLNELHGEKLTVCIEDINHLDNSGTRVLINIMYKISNRG